MKPWTIHTGDVAKVARGLERCSFDAILSDPPYGLAFMGRRWDYYVPSAATWGVLLTLLKPGGAAFIFGGSRTFHRLAVAVEDGGFEIRDVLMWLHAQGWPKTRDVLKPAYEPILFARRFLDGTVAENVAKWGTGALAIDACRVTRAKGEVPAGWYSTGSGASENRAMSGPNLAREAEGEPTVGRWPANVALDEAAAEHLDAEVGDRPSTPYRENVATGAVLPLARRTAGGFKETGGPSRFFFTSKATAADRNSGGVVDNRHETVKPTDLTRHLARLVLPAKVPGGGPRRILVPFSGSGSEMIGALQAGWDEVVGIEIEPRYVEIATTRIMKGKPFEVRKGKK